MDELLKVELAGRQGALELRVSFGLSAPWTCLFGASGSGKSTVLRAIAGFVRMDRAEISLCGRVLESSSAGLRVPAPERGVRSAGQQVWLFPGTVLTNLRYGVRREEDVDEVLRLFRLEGLAGKSFNQLSGGERQRVSVARAVAAAAVSGRAKLLLLDEPFGGMDGGLRDVLAGELRDWLGKRRVPVLSVTHDVGEAFLLGAEVVRMVEGAVVEQGPVEAVLAEERRRVLGVLGG